MQLTNSFTVDVEPARLWEILTDVERIAPCVPGFALTEAHDPEYRGTMSIKVGAITMRYNAVITFVERDDAAHRVVLSVRGKERQGPGDVTATVTSTLTGDGARTTAEMVTELQVTGRVAQFGRSILADVSGSIMDDFVRSLNERLLSPAVDGEAAPKSSQPPPPVDIGAAAAGAVARRVGPALGAAVLIGLVVAWFVRGR